jgi:glycerol kinase
MDGFILTIDQGTTGSRAALIDHAGNVAGEAYQEFRQILPQPGWVEHDADEIWQSVNAVVDKAVNGRWGQVRGIGITNQRETVVVWDRATGKPVHHAIVWQDRRTADRCRQLEPRAEMIRAKTGLVVDAYFSATKLEWLLKNVPGLHARAGDLAAGTIDTWLVWKLTGGRAHVTDYTNASRTMLYDIHARRWDEDLLKLFGVPRAVLPDVKGSSEVVGHTGPTVTGGRSIPIAGIAGDQQAALFGQQAWSPGEAKNTYGTGAFLLMNVGDRHVESRHNLLTTLACDERGRPVYALEGSIFIAGAAVQWLRDQLGIIATSAECDGMARSTNDNGGVYFIPAFVGLGAPHWNSDVRGAIFGLTRGSNKCHLVRAALEAMAYQSKEVLEAMQLDANVPLTELRTDGGASRNDWLMQFQADVLNVPVVRSANVEMTAVGAAYLAGLAVGFWDTDALRGMAASGKRFAPADVAGATRGYQAWAEYLRRLL